MDRVKYIDSDIVFSLSLSCRTWVGIHSLSSVSWQNVAIELDLSIDPAGLSSCGIVLSFLFVFRRCLIHVL